ncbi:39S ribosomal protein L52, mitochondrial [Belonocnema kinseyi]|uniref:39S ribosomal protein L52, mitochondrial n=1 Tax=Belonocnema kinseyi TaxID=2817044 RepID=UPI00143D10A8|nr:39S ribosomal protein L52, mitochondrial [Belonocnema kinseyi]
MALCKNILFFAQPEFRVIVHGFKTSSSVSIDQYWRMQKGLTANPNAFGPLTNLPDYSFKDGRPTPYGVNQKRKIVKNREYAAKIVRLVGEVDYAVERYDRLIKEKQEEQRRIIDSKLKAKGELLLAQKKDS